MTITTFSFKQMIDNINSNFENVKNLLKLYLKNPNDKNIHDLRKSIRRLNAAYYALPKKYRKNKPIKHYVNLGQNLFKLNSQIRDYDIFLEKIDGHNGFNKKNNPLKDKFNKKKNFSSKLLKR